MSEYPDCELSVYIAIPCKTPRYPMFPTERPKFYVQNNNFTETDGEFTFDVVFEDEESARAFTMYCDLGIECELLLNQDDRR